MGPTNIALVKLYRADQALREAQERLDAASKNVRVQERRVNDLSEKHRLAQMALREQQAKVGSLDLDLKSRDAHIEKLRRQQQTAKNNKEYQTFLIEINTAKVDRNKVEEQALKGMEAVEKGQSELAVLSTALEAERAKLNAMKEQIGDTLAQLQAEVQATRPARDEAARALPPQALAAFERLAEHHDGEAMAAIAHPNRRREEYVCTACNMDLVTDIYNKLHSRDELVFCPSCRRILFIPEDMPVETSIKSRPTPRPIVVRARGTRSKTTADPIDETTVVIEHRAKGKLGKVLSKAQEETVRSANAAGQNPIECEVHVGGEMAGIYKGQSAEHLARAVRYYLAEAKIDGEVMVKPLTEEALTEDGVEARGAGASGEMSGQLSGEVSVEASGDGAAGGEMPAQGDEAAGASESTAGENVPMSRDAAGPSERAASDSVAADPAASQPEPRSS